jgi:SulP family sulfate permease
VEALVSSSAHPIHTVIVDLDANDELDITSSEKLAKLVEAMHKRDIRVGLAHVHVPALDMARRTGILDKIGTVHIFPTLAVAVAWARTGTEEEPLEGAG